MKNLGLLFAILALAACGSDTGTFADVDGGVSADGMVGSPDSSAQRPDATSTSPDATPDATPVCTADTTSDPSNCGACGHSCLGSSCSDSECQVNIIESALAGDQRITALVADPTYVFYAIQTDTETQVYKKFANGAGLREKIVQGPATSLQQLAHDTDYVYTPFDGRIADLTSASIWARYKPSNTGSFFLQMNLEVLTGSVLKHDGHIYWSSDTDAVSGSMIRRIPSGGGTAELVYQTPNGARFITTDGSNIFWSTADGYLYSGPLSSPTPLNPSITNLHGPATRAAEFGVGDSRIVWRATNTGNVRSIPKTGGSATDIAVASGGVAMHDNVVYLAIGPELQAVTPFGVLLLTLKTYDPSTVPGPCTVTGEPRRMWVDGGFLYYVVEFVSNDCPGPAYKTELHRTPLL